MTREDAIEILEKIQTESTIINRDLAIEMAIAALKAEPCEDAVSREHLLSEIDKLMQSPWFNRYKDDIGVLRHGYIERKEAVEVVRDLCVKTEPFVTPKPTECEDAVKREAVLSALSELPHEYKTKEQRARTGGIAACQVIVRELPPVTPKQRTGKWIEFRHEEWANNIYIKCSECGKIYHRDEKEFNFCPNCGAKMEGESE